MKKTLNIIISTFICASIISLQSTSASADIVKWPGKDEVEIITDLTFMDNSSGLDYADGKLYAVDNCQGKLFVVNVTVDGKLEFAEGYENGKTVAGNLDAEGVTVDGDGKVYIASERENSSLVANTNSLVQVDPNADSEVLAAENKWDLTEYLPITMVNKGIEGVEWVQTDEVNGILADSNSGEPFDAAGYPDMAADGLFFVGLEANGHVYAFVLNNDGTAVLINDIDTGLEGVMALDYDVRNHKLWAHADSAYGNVNAVISLEDTDPDNIIYYAPPAGDRETHNEGFAISDNVADGMTAVYMLADGPLNNQLSVAYLDAQY